jgi:hypothetical protein
MSPPGVLDEFEFSGSSLVSMSIGASPPSNSKSFYFSPDSALSPMGGGGGAGGM